MTNLSGPPPGAGSGGPPDSAGGLRVRHRPPAPARLDPAGTTGVSAAALRPALSSAERRRARVGRRREIASWVLFLLLGGALAAVRFRTGWPGVSLESLKVYGLLAVAAVYLLGIVLALADTMVEGLLALVVPGYPLYYLLCVCGLLPARAAAGAVLVAFGYDAVLWLQQAALRLGDKVQAWIQNA